MNALKASGKYTGGLVDIQPLFYLYLYFIAIRPYTRNILA